MFEILKHPNRRKTITAYIIFGAISLVFVFMGMDYGTNPAGGHAAIVNDQIISPKELESAYNQLQRVYGNMFGGGNAMQGQNFLRQMALNQLVNQTLVNDYAHQLGVQVSKAELQDFIINIPAFQNEGSFRKDYYQNFLQNQGYSGFQFEKQLRRELGFQKVQEFFKYLASPSQVELSQEQALVSQARVAKFIKWDENSFPQASEAEIKKWSQSHSAEIEKYYQENPQEFTSPEQVRARHILLKTEGKDNAAKAELLKKLQNIKQEATAENFAQLATQHSEDSGSASQGGDLGYFGRGQMVEAFEKAAFAASVGQIPDIVESNFGYHLLYIEDKKAAGSKELALVRDEIAKKILQKNRLQEFEAALSQAASNSKKLEALAKRYGLKIEETGELLANSEYIPGAGRAEALIDALFAMKEKASAQIVEAAGSKYWLQLEKLITKKDVSVGESLRERIAAKHSSSLLGDWTKEVEKQAKVVRNEAYVKP